MQKKYLGKRQFILTENSIKNIAFIFIVFLLMDSKGKLLINNYFKLI